MDKTISIQTLKKIANAPKQTLNVFCYMIENMDDTNTIVDPIADIAKDLKLSPRTIYRQIEYLKKNKIISIERSKYRANYHISE